MRGQGHISWSVGIPDIQKCSGNTELIDSEANFFGHASNVRISQVASIKIGHHVQDSHRDNGVELELPKQPLARSNRIKVLRTSVCNISPGLTYVELSHHLPFLDWVDVV